MQSRNFIEILREEFKDYGLSSLKNDLLAGLTVAAVALPLALAFGVASGSTASAGLVTAIIAGLVIGLFSGAGFQISGPTGAMSAVLIGLSQQHGVEGVWIAGAVSGVLLLLIGFFRLGRFVSFIPAPVIVGFTSGISLIIFLGQLDHFLGIEMPGAGSGLAKLGYLLSHDNLKVQSDFYLGIFVILGIWLWPARFNRVVPSSLFFLIAATILAGYLDLNLAKIGEVPRQIFLDQRLNFDLISWEKISGMFIPIIAITALGAVESLLCGTVGSSMTGKRMYANQELIGQGIGNLIIPFFGGVPATAAIARTSVAIKSGAVTRLTSIIHALVLLLTVYFLAGVMSQIPFAVLAAILIVTAWKMNDWHAINFYFKKRIYSAILPFLVTMIATVSFDLTEAIIIGTVISALIFVTQASKLNISVSKVDAESLQKSEIKYSEIFNETSIVYVSGLLFFAAAGVFYEEISKLKSSRVIILSMRGVPLIDTSGFEMLDKIYEELKSRSGILILAGLAPEVEGFLNKVGFLDKLGRQNVFWSTDVALRQIGKV